MRMVEERDTAPVEDTEPLPAPAPASRETFWDSHQALRRVRAAADARGVGRWALLASCLARVATYVPLDTVLPAIVGSYASLNFYVAIAASSSGGKSTAQAVARELLPIPEVPKMPLSTGQGLVASYVQFIPSRKGNAREGIEPVPEHLERTETAILFTVDEIGDIAAKAANGSSNLMPVIRAAWGAEHQGSSTVTKENRLRLNTHSYRMSLIINTQLGASRFLINDTDVGTPQRFLWVPAIDHTELTEDDILAMSSEDLAPSDEAVEPISISHMSFERLHALNLDTPDWFHKVRVCQDAQDEVRRDRLRAQAGLPTRYPPHHLLNRLKTASLLAFLCGTMGSVTDEFWALSGVLMAVSEDTKEMLAVHAEAEELEEAEKMGKRSAHIEAAKQETMTSEADAKVEKAKERIVEKMTGGPLSRRDIAKLFNSRNRPYGGRALTSLMEDGTVVFNEDDDNYELSE